METGQYYQTNHQNTYQLNEFEGKVALVTCINRIRRLLQQQTLFGANTVFSLADRVDHYLSITYEKILSIEWEWNFLTYLLANFVRYISFGSFDMLVFIETDIIKWKQHSKDFPFTHLLEDSKFPTITAAGDFYNKGFLEKQLRKIGVLEWLQRIFQSNIRLIVFEKSVIAMVAISLLLT